MYMDNIFKYLLVIFFYWESCLFEFLNELKRGVELGVDMFIFFGELNDCIM